MKSFLTLTGLIILGLTISINTFAQKDFSAKLKKDIVTIEAGKYNATDYYYLKFTNGNTAQMKVSAICPTEVMSRDNFIGIFSSYSMVLLLATFSESEAGLPDIKDLDELIGDPDITYNFVMAKNGIQIQVITAEGKENVTTKWEDLFED